MKRLLVAGITLFFTLATAFAAEKTDKAFNDIKENLQKKGVASEDIHNVKKSVEEMLEKGAAKDEIEKPLSELSKNGIKGRDFKKSVDSMNDMVKKGKSPKEAGNIVSEAVHKAQAEGLRGTALADRVHQAIKEKQAEKRGLKELKQEQKKTGTHEKNIEEKSKKERFPIEKSGGNKGHSGGGHGHNR